MKPRKNSKQTGQNSPIRDIGVNTLARSTVPATEERIRQRAHRLHLARGDRPGNELEDWLQAERELEVEMRKSSQDQS